MKALRIVYYIIFTLSALVTVNFIFAAFQYRFNVVDWELLISALIIFAVQIAGLVAVIFDMNKVVMCILSFAAGIVTLFSGVAALSGKCTNEKETSNSELNLCISTIKTHGKSVTNSILYKCLV